LQVTRTTGKEVDVSPFDRVIEKATAASPTGDAEAPPAGHVDLLTVAEAAGMLRVSEGTIRNWIAAGSIPYIQLPPVGPRKHYRIPLQGLLGSLEGNYDLRDGLQQQNTRMREANLSED
jgi:excisionase family DNA binding protein